jgi:hypothetical protein
MWEGERRAEEVKTQRERERGGQDTGTGDEMSI